jgi:hypothetical protein
MNRGSILAILAALQAERVRYLIVGGLAVVHHGHLRFTADLDLVLDMRPDNVLGAIRALQSLGYRPRVPVRFEEFADPAARESWRREKNMKVFSVWSPEHQATVIDLFVECPFDFERAAAAADRQPLAPGVDACFVGLEDLLALKAAAARPLDLDDIANLKRIGHGPDRRPPAAG